MALTRSTPLQLYWNISKLSRQPAVIGFRNYSTDDFKSILDRIGDNLSQGMGSNPPKGENSSLKWENNNSRSFDNEDGGNQKGGFRQGGFSSNNRFGGGNRGFSNQNQGGYNQRGQGGFGGQGGYGGQGGFGGGGGRFGQPGGQGFGGRNSMPTLNPLDWNGVQLAKVVKNCYKEHPSVTNMPKEDVAAFRQKSKITTKGNDIPNPVFEFENTSFPQEIIDVLKSEYKTPTPIQSQGWPVALSGRDMVGSSQTGSGKTVGFLLPALVHIMTQISHTPHKWTDGPIAVVLAPTRELAVQIMDEARPFLPKLGLRATAVYGGSPKPPQALSLKQGPHLVVATPGRLIDMLEEGHTNLRRCTYIVLDEADRMLDMGFEPQIRSILSQVRPDRQTLMWSATWPDKIQKLANEFFKDPVTIHVGSTELSANPNVKQHVHVVEGAQKDEKILALVKQLMEEHSKPKILIFAGTQGGADRLCYGLQSEGMRSVGSIHGGKQQHARQAVLNMFRNGRTNILVATDVAARGLDIDDVSHVINYDFPKQIEDYIHRIGRTGRAGRLGTSHSFFTPDIISLKLLPELLDVMRTAGQEVSQEMLQLHQQSFGFRGNRFGGSFGGGGNRFGNRQGGNRFGGENRFGSGGGNRFGGNRDGGNRDGGFNNNNQRQNLQQSKQDKDDFLSEDNFRDSRSTSRSGGSKSRSQDDIDEDWDMEDEYDNRKGGRR